MVQGATGPGTYLANVPAPPSRIRTYAVKTTHWNRLFSDRALRLMPAVEGWLVQVAAGPGYPPYTGPDTTFRGTLLFNKNHHLKRFCPGSVLQTATLRRVAGTWF